MKGLKIIYLEEEDRQGGNQQENNREEEKQKKKCSNEELFNLIYQRNIGSQVNFYLLFKIIFNSY